VAGSPAKIIRYRFDDDTIKIIEESKWWNYSPDECMKYYEYISEPKEFCRRITDG